jgi:hypothetical protein
MARLLTRDPRRPIGFRPTEPLPALGLAIGWRVWAGPVLLCRSGRRRARPRFEASRVWRYVSVTWLGLHLSVALNPKGGIR